MNRFKNKHLIIIVFLLTIIMLSIGFSAFQKQLLIDDSIFQVRIHEDVRVSNSALQKVSGSAVSNFEDFNKTKILGNVTFSSTSSYVLYKVDLTNYGNIKSGLLSIDNNTSGTNYSICDSNGNNCTTNVKTPVCNGSNCTLGSTKEIYVKLSPTSTGTKTIDLDLNFKPYHNITYDNFNENISSFPVEIMEDDTLEVTLTGNVEDVGVTGDGSATYNKTNKKLTISNVNGDITITAKYLLFDIAQEGYTETDPNNYVRFDNTLFRIVTKSSFSDGYGNNELRVKIIKDESIGQYMFDESINEFDRSSIREVLNTTYYNSLSDIAKNLIDTVSYNYASTANVVLIVREDFAKNSSWLNKDQFTMTPVEPSVQVLPKGKYITISPSNVLNDYKVRKTANAVGKIYIIINGLIEGSITSNVLDTYPNVVLTSDTLVIGGTGTKTNPYLLEKKGDALLPNPTRINGKTLTVTGSYQQLVTVENKTGTPYYSTSTVLNESNYSTSGSTTIPSARDVGNYMVYYYIPQTGVYKAKAGAKHSTINGITYTINYQKGENVTSISKTSDSCTTEEHDLDCSVSLPSIIPDSGYGNTKWTDGTDDYPINYAYNLSSSNNNTTLIANATANNYTVSFNVNGGPFDYQQIAVTATYGSPMPAINTTPPTRTGYTFMGWYDNELYTAGTQYYTAAGVSARSYDKTKNTTLYAGWKINNPATPTISSGGTNVYGNLRQLTCSSSTAYATGTTKYYSFGYATTDGGTPSNWTTASTTNTYNAPANMTTRYYSCRVYASDGTQTSSTVASSTSSDAQVTYVNARIDFDATTNGGTLSGSTPRYARYNDSNLYTTRTGSTTSTIPTATKTGWTFNGWWTAASGGSQVINSSGTIQANVTNWTNSKGQFILTNTSSTQNTYRLYAQFRGNIYTATFYYNSNATSGSVTVATATYTCQVSSGSSCTVGVPEVVLNSVGKYNSAYKGVNTARNMSSASLTISGDTTFYANYSSPITIYYPNTSNGISNSSTSLYRNEYFNTNNPPTDMLTITATSNTSTTQATSVTLSNLKGTLKGINRTANTTSYYGINNVDNVINRSEKAFYAIVTASENVTFKYNNNTTCGSAVVTTSTSSVTSTYYCASTSSMGTSHGTTTSVPVAVSNSKGQYNTAYRAIANVNSLTPVTTFTGGQTYYAIYSSNVTNYFYNGSSFTNRTLKRNEYLSSTSASTYTAVINSANTNTTNYSTATGPNNAPWYGLADTNTTTRKYSSVAEAATSNTCTTTLYTIYDYNVTYAKGSNVSSIGNNSGICYLKHGDTSCSVTLPSITPSNGYESAGWNTTNGATTGTAAGQSYTISNNTTKLYANAIIANYQNTSTNVFYSTLNDAFSAVANNQTIKVLQNVTETSNISLANTKSGIKLDLNGKTITSSICIGNGGELDIYNTSSTQGIIDGGSDSCLIGNSGKLTINKTSSTNKVTIRTTNNALSSYAINNSQSTSELTIYSNVYVESVQSPIGNSGLFTNSGGNLTSSSSQAIFYFSGSTTIINSGTISGKYGMYTYQGDTIITINGGTLEGTNDAVVTHGQLIIKGGVFNGDVNVNTNATATISGTPTINGELSVFATAVMTGGTINNNKTWAVQVSSGATFTLGTNDSTVSVSSPSITCTDTTSNYGAITVSTGGIFNFYDGIIKSSRGTGYAITGNVNSIPASYSIYKETTNGVESAYLVKDAILMNGTSGTQTTNYLRTNIKKQDIESITFANSIGSHTANGTNCWDVSKDQDGMVLAWVTDVDSNNKYEMTIGANGTIYASSGNHLFRNLVNLDSLNGMNNFDTSNVTDMSYMFYYTGYNSTVFTLDLGDKFDTSSVTTMGNMFRQTGYSSTTFTLDLGKKFDTSKVTDMHDMFFYTGYNSTTFTLDLEEKFDTSNVTNMSSMFQDTGYSSTVFTLDLGEKFDTSNVVNMKYMFSNTGYNSTVFTLDLGEKFDTSKVTDMSYMFYNTGYNSTTFTLDLGEKFDTSQVTTMYGMFWSIGRSSTIFTLDLGEKFDTSNVTNMSYMFFYTGYNNTSFTLNLGEIFDTSKVTDMSSMFQDTGYSSTVFTLDLGDKFNTSNVTDMSNMFYFTGYNSTVFTLDLGEKFDTSNVTTMLGMFRSIGYSSTIFTLDLGEKFDTSNVTVMHDMFSNTGYNSTLFTLDLGDEFDTSSVTKMGNMFRQTGYSSTTFTLDLGEKFDTSQVTDMSYMFSNTGYNSTIFTLDLGGKFNTSNVTDMINMFYFTGYNSTVFTLDLGEKFDTSKVTDMSSMYSYTGYKNTSFTLNLGNKFDTSNVTNMQSMFYNAGYSNTSFTLDLGDKFDTSNVTNMGNMFANSRYLKTIYVSNSFDTTNVTNSGGMFSGCTSLVGGAGTTFNSSYIDATYAHIDGGTSNPGYFTQRSASQSNSSNNSVLNINNLSNSILNTASDLRRKIDEITN